MATDALTRFFFSGISSVSLALCFSAIRRRDFLLSLLQAFFFLPRSFSCRNAVYSAFPLFSPSLRPHARYAPFFFANFPSLPLLRCFAEVTWSLFRSTFRFVRRPRFGLHSASLLAGLHLRQFLFRFQPKPEFLSNTGCACLLLVQNRFPSVDSSASGPFFRFKSFLFSVAAVSHRSHFYL